MPDNMRRRTQKRRVHSERGVAIVIAIFTLMLISVVATAMILMSGTDSAIKSNYKSAMHAFYDAKAGLEEGRGRPFWPNPNIPNPLLYNGVHQLASSGGNPVPNAVQVLTITALAVTPYGSRRMVQYTVAVSPLATALPTFPSALTLDGNGVSFTGPNAGNGNGNGNGGGPGSFQINGKDSSAGPSGSSGVPAIAYTNSTACPIIPTPPPPPRN